MGTTGDVHLSLMFPALEMIDPGPGSCVNRERAGWAGDRAFARIRMNGDVPERIPHDVTHSVDSSTTQTERWSVLNAATVLAATVFAVWWESPWPPLVAGTLLLGGLVLVARKRWTQQGRFGAANAMTTLRLGLLCLLPPAHGAGPTVLVAISVSILAMDGVDGWIARRWRLTSEFGSFFDKETDALFLLLLCVMAALEGHLGSWIIGAGVLRYGFVLVLFFGPAPDKTEQTSDWARYVYTAMVLALLTTFVFSAPVSRPLVFLASAALITSFAQSLWRVFERRPVVGRS